MSPRRELGPRVLAVTVLGDDRPGIVAELTAALAELGGNLEDSTMTLLRGHFAMVVLVRTEAPMSQVEAALEPLGESGALNVDVRELAESAASDPTAQGRLWALRVHGADRPGIVAALTQVVAEHGGNIVDLGTRLGTGLYVLLAEVALPPGADPDPLGDALRAAAATLGVRVHFDPVDDEVL
jgi:glycine cleavage system transcriptional repressor